MILYSIITNNKQRRGADIKRALLSLLLFLLPTSIHGSKIAIIGCGYVGLTTASVLSLCGHTITCIDIDTEKILTLSQKKLPLYEPKLKELLFNASKSNAIRFVNDLKQALDAEIFYICVGTPTKSDGSCDCTMLYSVFRDIVRECSNTHSLKIICVKSTVPPGTMRKLHNEIVQEKKETLQMVYNPEFMREGSAIDDVLNNNPLVIAAESQEAIEIVEKVYNALIHSNSKIIKTNFETAELIKYSWNSFSAIRIAYVNELALLGRSFDIDLSLVIQGLALSEKLLPTHSLKPGPGYGGSCLPKDTLSFANILEKNGFSSSMIHQAINSNQKHIAKLIADIFALLGTHKSQKTVTLLGLAFKAHTSDIRNAPSINIIKALLDKGITVKAYDPKAINTMSKLFPQIEYFDCPYEAVKNTDCIVALTEWDEIKKLDFEKISKLCHKKVIIDTRNMYDIKELKKQNFTCVTMGNTCGL